MDQAVIRAPIWALLARVLLVGALLLPTGVAMADSNPNFLFQSDVPAPFKYGDPSADKAIRGGWISNRQLGRNLS